MVLLCRQAILWRVLGHRVAADPHAVSVHVLLHSDVYL